MDRVSRVDRGQMGGVRRTPQGFLRVDDSTPTRTGILIYRNPDGSTRRELRHPEDVGDPASLATLQAVPVTDEHPPGMVTAANAMQYSRGHTSDDVRLDGKLVKTSVTIQDAGLIAKIDAKKAVELSCGYHCDLEMEPGTFEGQPYDARQRNITYNHVAVVPRGRAGPSARLNIDAAEDITDTTPETPEEGRNTPMPKITIDGVELEVPDAGTALAISNKLRADAARITTFEGEVAAAKKDATDAKALADATQGKLDGTKAKLDAAEAKIAERKDGDIGALVTARLGLVQQAIAFLPKETKLDELQPLTDRELKEKVILTLSPKTDLKDRSDAYIDARFDAAVEDGDRHDHTGELRNGATPRPTPAPGQGGGEQRVDADEARQAMILRHRNAYKTQEAK